MIKRILVYSDNNTNNCYNTLIERLNEANALLGKDKRVQECITEIKQDSQLIVDILSQRKLSYTNKEKKVAKDALNNIKLVNEAIRNAIIAGKLSKENDKAFGMLHEKVNEAIFEVKKVLWGITEQGKSYVSKEQRAFLKRQGRRK